MARVLFPAALVTAFVMHAQQAPPSPPPAPTAAQEQEPPEEDESLKPKEYSLNPLQAQKEITAGNYYAKKGNFRAAQNRYRESTRWDPGAAEGFLKLGESSEKLHDYSTALEAYTKYLELDKNAKDADALRKRIAKWPASKADSGKK